MRHIFNLNNNSYKNILIRLIDTDVLVLLMSYYGQVELIDKLTGITTSNIIRELGSDIFLALPFF